MRRIFKGSDLSAIRELDFTPSDFQSNPQLWLSACLEAMQADIQWLTDCASGSAEVIDVLQDEAGQMVHLRASAIAAVARAAAAFHAEDVSGVEWLDRAADKWTQAHRPTPLLRTPAPQDDARSNARRISGFSDRSSDLIFAWLTEGSMSLESRAAIGEVLSALAESRLRIPPVTARVLFPIFGGYDTPPCFWFCVRDGLMPPLSMADPLRLCFSDPPAAPFTASIEAAHQAAMSITELRDRHVRWSILNVEGKAPEELEAFSGESVGLAAGLAFSRRTTFRWAATGAISAYDGSVIDLGPEGEYPAKLRAIDRLRRQGEVSGLLVPADDEDLARRAQRNRNDRPVPVKGVENLRAALSEGAESRSTRLRRGFRFLRSARRAKLAVACAVVIGVLALTVPSLIGPKAVPASNLTLEVGGANTLTWWPPPVVVAPGEPLRHRVRFTNTTSDTLTGAVLKVRLPSEGATFQPASVQVFSNRFPNGQAKYEADVRKGIQLGSIPPGESVAVTFLVNTSPTPQEDIYGIREAIHVTAGQFSEARTFDTARISGDPIWGPDRRVVITNPTDPPQTRALPYVSMNSWLNYQQDHLDTRQFFTAKTSYFKELPNPFQNPNEAETGGRQDPVSVSAGEKWRLETFVFNSSDRRDARGTRVQIDLPTGSTSAAIAVSHITADNATPDSVYDTLRLRGSFPFRLEYIPNSAWQWDGEWRQLSDSIVEPGGVLVGVPRPNGHLSSERPHDSVRVYISVKIIPVRVHTPGEWGNQRTPSFVVKTGKPGASWRDFERAHPGAWISWYMHALNETAEFQDFVFQASLPDGLALIPGSVKMVTTRYKDGYPLQDESLFGSGVDAGGFLKGGGVYIKFSTRVASSVDGCGNRVFRVNGFLSSHRGQGPTRIDSAGAAVAVFFPCR